MGSKENIFLKWVFVNILNYLGVRRKYFPASKHINQTTKCFQKLVFMLPNLIISISTKSKVLQKVNCNNGFWKWETRLFTPDLESPWQIVLNNIRPNFSLKFANFKQIPDNIWCLMTLLFNIWVIWQIMAGCFGALVTWQHF